MPNAAPTPCTYPGCMALTEGGRCVAHKRVEQIDYDRRRGSSSARGYGYRWQKYVKNYINRHPLCRQCETDDKLVAAEHVDHIVPLADGGDMWDGANHQPLCRSCHSRKTALENLLGHTPMTATGGG